MRRQRAHTAYRAKERRSCSRVSTGLSEGVVFAEVDTVYLYSIANLSRAPDYPSRIDGFVRMQPLLITLGDPAGIGPEVLAKFLCANFAVGKPLVGDAPVVVIGSAEGLRAGAASAGVTLPDFGQPVGHRQSADLAPGLWLCDLGPCPPISATARFRRVAVPRPYVRWNLPPTGACRARRVRW